MALKLYMLLGLVIVVALIILVSLENDTEMDPEEEAASVFHGSNPLAEAPSRENASESIRETIAHLRNIVAEHPDDASSLFELATLLHNSHNPEEAAHFYERGLAIEPEDVDFRVDYSLCLFELGRKEESLAQNRVILNIEPTNIKALYNIGAIHANAGRRDSAAIYWRRVISYDAEDKLAAQAQDNIIRLGEPSINQ